MRGLPQVDGLPGDLQQCLRLQGVVKGLIRDQDDILPGGDLVGLLRALLQLGRGDEIGGVSEVGDELRESDAAADAGEEARCGERTGRDAAGVVRILRSERGGEGGLLR